MDSEGDLSDGSGDREKLDSQNVFVKYLPHDVDDEALEALFAPHGEIVSCKVMIDHMNGNSLGYGFVRFKTDKEAQKAIGEMNGHRVQNKTLLCKLSHYSPTRSAVKPSNNLFIKPLLMQTTEEQLQAMFSAYGKILEVKVMIDKRTGLSRQIGFVRYERVEDATVAMQAMNGVKLDENAIPLVVKYAETEAQKQHRKKRQAAARSVTGGPGVGGTAVRHSSVPLGASAGSTPFVGSPAAAAPMFYPAAYAAYTQLLYGAAQRSVEQQRNGTLAASPYAGLEQLGAMPYASLAALSQLPGLYAAQHAASKSNGMPTMPTIPMAAPHHPPPSYHEVQPGLDNLGSAPTGYDGVSPPGADSTNLFVFHLPADVDDDMLYRLFAPFGSLESVKVIADKRTGDSKGFGFVKYYRYVDAVAAIHAMDGYQIGRKHLKVSFKTSRPQHPGSDRASSGASGASSGRRASASPHPHGRRESPVTPPPYRDQRDLQRDVPQPPQRMRGLLSSTPDDEEEEDEQSS